MRTNSEKKKIIISNEQILFYRVFLQDKHWKDITELEKIFDKRNLAEEYISRLRKNKMQSVWNIILETFCLNKIEILERWE